MIVRRYNTLYEAWRKPVEELAYDPEIIPLKWGVCLGFPQLLCVEMEDILEDSDMHLDMASFTKSRWTRFLRRYFRDDLLGWVKESMEKLNRYPSRPFVASYSVNLNTGHNYGGCISSLQFRISPLPEVILYSRACQMDKIGFLDLTLMHVIAKMMGTSTVKGSWVVTNGFISAISQIYYLQRFNLPTEGHRLKRTMSRLTSVAYEDIKFGPLKRGRKRMMALTELGRIPKAVPICDLTIQESVFKK